MIKVLRKSPQSVSRLEWTLTVMRPKKSPTKNERKKIMKKKIIISSIMTIVLCLSIIAGSTYALFTSEDKVDIAITAGKVKLEAFVKDGFTYSTIFNEYTSNTRFENGGDAIWAEKAVTINRMAPGDKLEFDIKMINNSDIDIQYRVAWAFATDGDYKLNEKLVVTGETEWAEWLITDPKVTEKTTTVTVTLPTEVGNDYQEAKGKIIFTVYAVQWNGLEFIAAPGDLDMILDTALPGSTVMLTGEDYGDITIDQELTDVTIVADPATSARIKISAEAKLDNVTFENLNIAGLDGFGNYDGVISIASGAQADITFKNCAFAPNAGYSSVRSYEPTAKLEFVGCDFTSGRYAVYKSGAAVEELIFRDCDFANITSWVAQNHGDETDSDVVFENCTFNNCAGGIYKVLSNTATFTFVDNTLTNCTGHDGNDAKWFSIDETLFNSDSVTISGNTLDGAAWNPTAANAKG